jgi:cellulose synthase operon protein C
MTCLIGCHYANHMRYIANRPVKTSLIKPFPKRVLPIALWIAVLAGCGTESHEGLITSAKNFIAKNDCAAASIQLKNALQKRDNPEARYLLAKCAIASGHYAQALPELRKAMEAGYAPDLVLPEFAQTLLETGDFKRLIPPPTPQSRLQLATPIWR